MLSRSTSSVHLQLFCREQAPGPSSAAAPAATASPQHVHRVNPLHPHRRKATAEQAAIPLLHHFLHTVRGLHVALAKAIHTPSRRREEVIASPTLPMQAAAVTLGVVLRAGLALPVPPVRCPSERPLMMSSLSPVASAKFSLVMQSTQCKVTCCQLYLYQPDALNWPSYPCT